VLKTNAGSPISVSGENKYGRNAHDTYLEERILSADPVELVQMLYNAAIRAVSEARRHLAERQISERARSISKVWDILMELNTSLNFERQRNEGARISYTSTCIAACQSRGQLPAERRTSRRSGAGLR
jgi:hypothetical protein